MSTEALNANLKDPSNNSNNKNENHENDDDDGVNLVIKSKDNENCNNNDNGDNNDDTKNNDNPSINNNGDDTERSLGIASYLSKDMAGFSAVVKGRFSDFLVHEVDLNGNMAKLTNMDCDNSNNENATAASLKKEVEEEKQVDTQNQQGQQQQERKRKRDNEQSTTMEWSNIKSDLLQWVSNEVATNVVTMLQSHNGNIGNDDGNDDSVVTKKPKIDDKTTTSTTNDEKEESTVVNPAMNDDISNATTIAKASTTNSKPTKFVTLPNEFDKMIRKQIHEWIREKLSSCARADTFDGKIRIWHKQFEQEMPNFKSFGTSKVKKNNKKKKSSNDWPSDRPDFLQFVLYKENIDTTSATKDILKKCGHHRRIGYAGMKDKRGITTQFCTLYKTEPQQISQFFQNSNNNNNNNIGGGNTKQRGYSVIRIGNFKYTSQELKLGSLQGNHFDLALRNVQVPATSTINEKKKILQSCATTLQQDGFINYFGTQRFGKYQDTHLVGIAVLQGNFEKAIDIILQPKPNANEKSEILQARNKWQNRFSKSNEQQQNDDDEKTEKANIESKCAKEILKSIKYCSRFMTAETSILQHLSKKPLEYKRAFSCISKTLRMMYVHAVQSFLWNHMASFRIDKFGKQIMVGDLVTIVNNTANKNDNDPGGDVHVVTCDNIHKYTMDDVVLPLIGTKTKFPTEMENIKTEIFQQFGIETKMFHTIQDRELKMAGDYRKVICRPTNMTFDTIEYYDPLQPLLQTDLMKLQNEQIEIVIKPDNDDNNNNDTASTTTTTTTPLPMLAMVVGFTLPSSAYATIALRELMKRPTSSEYQKDLKLQG